MNKSHVLKNLTFLALGMITMIFYAVALNRVAHRVDKSSGNPIEAQLAKAKLSVERLPASHYPLKN